jgi:Reverse transcriptase (RNA-dependent DNA polymerase)
MKLVNAFYYNELNLTQINLAFIYLIPKKKDANIIIQYRPISFINYSMKIITKLLIERLSPLIDSLISFTQTTYIEDKYIMDNLVCAHKVLLTIHKKIN